MSTVKNNLLYVPTKLPTIGTKLSGSLPTSGWTTNTDAFWTGSVVGKGQDTGVYVANKINIYSEVLSNTVIVVKYKVSDVSYTESTTNYRTLSDDIGTYKEYYFMSDYTYKYGIRIYENNDIYYYGLVSETLLSLTSADYGSKLYTISDTSIKTNSYAEMQLESSDVVTAYSKTDGSVVVEMDAVPSTAIPYELQILETSSESAFWIRNTYMPTVPVSVFNSTSGATSGTLSKTVSANKLYKIVVNCDSLVYTLYGRYNSQAATIYSECVLFSSMSDSSQSITKGYLSIVFDTDLLTFTITKLDKLQTYTQSVYEDGSGSQVSSQVVYTRTTAGTDAGLCNIISIEEL